MRSVLQRAKSSRSDCTEDTLSDSAAPGAAELPAGQTLFHTLASNSAIPGCRLVANMQLALAVIV